MATWRTRGQSGHITPAVLGVPNAHDGDKNEKWLPGPRKVAISPLPSRGSPTLSAGGKIRNGYGAHMWIKWLHHPSRFGCTQRLAQTNIINATWPTCGPRGYITPAVLGIPNAQRWDKKQKWLPRPDVGEVATSPLPCRRSPKLGAWTKISKTLPAPYVGKVTTSPLPSWGSPMVSARTKKKKWLAGPNVAKVAKSPLPTGGSPMLSLGTKNRNGYLTHMWAMWLHHPCLLGEPQRSARGQTSEMATWPTCGQSGYITPAVVGVPNTEHENKKNKWLPGPHVAKMAKSPLANWGSPTPSVRTKNQKWLPAPHLGKVAKSPLPSWGSATLSGGEKNRNGYLAHMWAKRLHHRCRLGGPQHSAPEQIREKATLPTCGQGG